MMTEYVDELYKHCNNAMKDDEDKEVIEIAEVTETPRKSKRSGKGKGKLA